MFEINITVNCPDLVDAATILATAMGGFKVKERVVATGPSNIAPIADQMPTAPVAPVNSIATGNTSVPPSYLAGIVPAAGVPLAQAPSFTPEQVSKAGADLITAQPAKMQELMGLLAQFGVQTIQALKSEQLGAFATALRGMGAQI